MLDIVIKNNGTLDKIVGDELMIVFGAPILGDDDTERAVRTAQEMMDTLKKLNKKRKKRGMSNINIGIGEGILMVDGAKGSVGGPLRCSLDSLLVEERGPP